MCHNRNVSENNLCKAVEGPISYPGILIMASCFITKLVNVEFHRCLDINREIPNLTTHGGMLESAVLKSVRMHKRHWLTAVVQLPSTSSLKLDFFSF